MELAGKHVFITGSGKRLGRLIAERVLQSNIKLSAHYRTSKNEVHELASSFKSVLPVQADLLVLKEIESAVAKAVLHHGPIDILINSAADFYPTPLATLTEEQWDHFQEVNLKGQLFLAREASRQMKHGLILNLADIFGSRPLKHHIAYSLSKAGVIAMTKALAKELAPIRVNCISPGWVLSPDTATDAQKTIATERALLGRLGNPEDIVEAVMFLIHNDYITGFNLNVDGGRVV